MFGIAPRLHLGFARRKSPTGRTPPPGDPSPADQEPEVTDKLTGLGNSVPGPHPVRAGPKP
jgi:hypothetical protein